MNIDHLSTLNLTKMTDDKQVKMMLESLLDAAYAGRGISNEGFMPVVHMVVTHEQFHAIKKHFATDQNLSMYQLIDSKLGSFKIQHCGVIVSFTPFYNQQHLEELKNLI